MISCTPLSINLVLNKIQSAKNLSILMLLNMQWPKYSLTLHHHSFEQVVLSKAAILFTLDNYAITLPCVEEQSIVRHSSEARYTIVSFLL